MNDVINKLELLKKILIKKVLWVVSPLLLLSILFIFANLLAPREQRKLVALVSFCSFSVLFFAWAIIFRFWLAIEKRSLVRNSFGPNGKSEKIVKLFFPAMVFRFLIFMRYYLGPFLAYVGTVIVFGFLIVTISWPASVEPFLIIAWVAILLLVGPASLWFAYLPLRSRLKYSWFIFLDEHEKSGFSYLKCLKKIKKMNEIENEAHSKKIISKSLAADQDLDAVAGISSGLGPISVAMTEATRQLGSLSLIASTYILYEKEKKELSNSDNSDAFR